MDAASNMVFIVVASGYEGQPSRGCRFNAPTHLLE